MVFPTQPEGPGGQTPALIASSPIPSLSLGPHTSFKLTRQESSLLFPPFLADFQNFQGTSNQLKI